MLILAGVTINIVINGGLIGYAQDAKNKTAQAKQDEEDAILMAEYEMAKLTGETGATTLNEYKLNQMGLKIGDYVKYEPTEVKDGYTADTSKGVGGATSGGGRNPTIEVGESYSTETDLNWRILGINNNGEIELISEKPTERVLYMKGIEAYVNGVNELNTLCNALYSNEEYAREARSVTVEDINTLTGFIPENYEVVEYDMMTGERTTEKPYGEIWNYRLTKNSEDESVLQYKKQGTNWSAIADSRFCDSFTYYNEQKKDWIELENEKDIETEQDITETEIKSRSEARLTSIFYRYDIEKAKIGEVKEKIISSFQVDDETTQGVLQGGSGYVFWLASPYVACDSGGAIFRFTLCGLKCGE